MGVAPTLATEAEPKADLVEGINLLLDRHRLQFIHPAAHVVNPKLVHAREDFDPLPRLHVVVNASCTFQKKSEDKMHNKYSGENTCGNGINLNERLSSDARCTLSICNLLDAMDNVISPSHIEERLGAVVVVDAKDVDASFILVG